ncbi:dihydropteroate synthase [Gardnerella vaginalis]|uniref:dihydropteroate synthase n=1 Tax=Gardnerella vaginalis TaxID=2702 RepID=A0A135Z8C2_GARVA|nr:dihydropteroate synthase [Gardnerella vaginalis]KXI17878.1 dihydropteroate synthase [Gardnerella vaginalis]
MKITLVQNIEAKSFAEQVLLDQVEQSQQLALQWEDIPVDYTKKIVDFLRHFDVSYYVKESCVQFMLPLIALKPFLSECEKLWNNDADLLESIHKILREKSIIWRAGRFCFDTLDKPIVYAILNITPDSFYDGGKYQSEKEVKDHIEEMIDAGADVIEVGGQTTKPGGYLEISPEDEIKRVIPAIRYIHDNYPKVAVAVDTYKLPVMKKAVEEGVDIVNDVRAFDTPEKVKLMAESNVGLVTMHSNRDKEYDNLTSSMCEFFKDNLQMLIDAGIDKNRIILDQGIGYAKVADGEQDYAMMRNINQLHRFGRPILVAISRKGFGKKLFNLDKEDRLPVTLVAQSAMFMRGGRVIRVHDVAETRQLVDMIDIINRSYWVK